MVYQQESEKRLSELIDDSKNLTNEILPGFIEKLINILSTSADNQGGKRKAKKAKVSKEDMASKISRGHKANICNAWADYFEELSTPISHSDFDSDHEDLVTNDIETLTTMFENHNIKILPTITIEEVSNTIMSFKNGKSPDQEGISAEHLKYGGPTLTSILTIIINYIFKNLYIPDLLKAGIATPVLKKGKQNTDPNSYRKITVTNIIGKVIEKIHLQHNNSLILKQQSKLQKGFTKNEMPTAAALILTELITEANKTRSPLYVALMDAKKAFDILWHAGLLREMYNFGLTGDNWTFFKNWYEDVTSRINGKGEHQDLC
ncbi:uncharacterized protein LOC117326426 [Pecten maximus]|uniref:uncharacterized protein LOC117326426 n=1 Tax=Pecten maximus TaxID=6579 RepID=UPI0014580ED9|nr:uncharacterized protein LOC117326426 [Pecten maximus]